MRILVFPFGALSRQLPLLLLALALASCTSKSVTDINIALSGLKGEHIDELVEHIGLPDRQATVAGSKVYTWGEYSCPIKVKVNDTDLIEEWQIGNSEPFPIGCNKFANSLRGGF